MQGDAPAVDKAESLARDEHYRLLIEDARSLRLSRENINDLFIGLMTLMLGAQGYLLVNFQGNDAASTFYIIGIAIAGVFVCSIWSRVLKGYKQLLSYRYLVLKYWEDRWFSKEQQFYVSEDALYEKDPAKWPKTPITDEVSKTFKRIQPFVDVYIVLPRYVRWALILVSLIRPGLLLIAYVPTIVSSFPPFIH
jgi:hypothetical protein